MKTILLGPNGQLGTDIRSANVAAGEPLQFRCVDRAALDLSDPRSTDALGTQNFECLVNCASYHKTDEVERNEQQAFEINARLVGRLAELCARKKARFVHISTDYVFGGQAKMTPLTEEDRRAPVNVYGASKGAGEVLALASGADVLILRVASLFGVAGASGKGGNFVETMIRLGREKAHLRVVNDQTMSPTATADVADALVKMLRMHASGGIWHVVNSGAATWHAFAERIIRQADIVATVEPISSAEFPTPAKRPSYSVLDNGKVGKAIGPMRAWQDALDSYLLAKGHMNRREAGSAR
jgi:dTDP-4-dehydrorhamnose reductase